MWSEKSSIMQGRELFAQLLKGAREHTLCGTFG